MALIETRVLRQLWEVEPRLIELGKLNRPGLLKARDLALGAAADATPFHPANAAGTFAYHHGVFALRDGFVGDDWKVDRPNGIEVIRNVSTNVMVAFANVDVACSDFHDPKPRSDKGSGAERAGQGNLFGVLPQFAGREDGIWSLYYLMVAENGAAELSCPVIEGGTFVSFVERLYLSNGDDFNRIARIMDDGDVASNFDPQVIRKRG